MWEMTTNAILISKKNPPLKHLNQHLKVDCSSAEAQFSCDKCSKIFKRKYKLQNHIDSVHEGIKKHQCDICGKKFTSAITVRDHVKTVHQKIKDHNINVIYVKKHFHLKVT